MYWILDLVVYNGCNRLITVRPPLLPPPERRSFLLDCWRANSMVGAPGLLAGLAADAIVVAAVEVVGIGRQDADGGVGGQNKGVGGRMVIAYLY